MRQTRLMHRLGEATIRCPPIADDHAAEVLTEQRGRFGIAASCEDRIHGRRGRGGGPEPVQVARDLPARFIRRDDGTAADLRTQRCIGRLATRRPDGPRGPTRSASRSTRTADEASVAILPNESPSCLLRMTTKARACAPSCALAAPSASDVCNGCRPCTRRPHWRHAPM